MELVYSCTKTVLSAF